VADLNVDRLENDWKTGAYGALLCIHQVLPGMREAGRGAILVTGASASLRGSASFGSFAASKSSLRALSQSLAKEVAPYGVHVAHVVVDALVDLGVGPSATAPPGRTLDTTAVAQVYHDLYSQDKRCFTFECDVRPHEAQW
jgi:NAD(P)-dependent dehydrogenase (short-subunit alcohol dehydrogenase family)